MIKKKIKELLDQATILKKYNNNEDIARYLVENDVLPFPMTLNSDVYFIYVRSPFGTWLTSGTVIKRKADELSFDGKFKIRSYRENPNDPCGNLYGEWGETVFGTEHEAKEALEKLQIKLSKNT